MNGFIKLDRKIMEWGWYDDNNTKALWLHLLLSAYWDESKYHQDIIYPGSFPISLQELSEQTGMSVKQVRNSLEKLKKTGEITTERRRYGMIITIPKWANYQGERAFKGQLQGNYRAFKGQSLYINEEYEEIKNIRNRDSLPVYDTSNNSVMDEDEAQELLTLMGKA